MGSNIQLSKRLSAIGEMVTEGNRLVDVGCDHGYLPVYLVMNHRIPGAIAADVGKGPLERAREHICRYHMQNYIETRLCDGLSGISVGEGDTLVIAGMGGPLMEKILSDNPEVRDSFQELILQPQSDIPHFRHFLMSNGYRITEEKMILEDGKFYPMMKAIRDQKAQRILDPSGGNVRQISSSGKESCIAAVFAERASYQAKYPYETSESRNRRNKKTKK